MDFNEYERIVIKDVRNKSYSRDLKILKITFILITAIFITIYALFFHSEILKNLKYIINIYRDSLFSQDYEFKFLIYNFNKIIAFMIFIFFFGIFLIFGFFAFDIISRNKIIGSYQKKLDELETKER